MVSIMFGGKDDYKFFVIVLSAAIVISLIFHFFLTPNEDVGFSEIFFPEPDSLPNKIFPGEEYSFAFTVHNLEGIPETYTTTSKVELYNLYDVTEGIYKCVSNQRKKLYLKMEAGNESTQDFYTTNLTSGKKGLHYLTFTGQEGKITWPHYTVEYRFTRAFDEGGESFTTVFHDEGDIKYAITYLEPSHEVILTYKEGNITKQERKRPRKIREANDITIQVNGTLTYKFNRETLFSVEGIVAEPGVIDFRMDELYGYVSNYRSYQDSPIEVTRFDLVKTFDVSNKVVGEEVKKIKQKALEAITLERATLNVTVPCKEEWCVSLQEYVNDPGNVYRHEIPLKKNSEERILSIIDTGTEEVFPTQAFVPNETLPSLEWDDYQLELKIQTFTLKSTILVVFDENFKVLFFNENVFVISLDGEFMRVTRQENPLQIGVNVLKVESNGGNLRVLVNKIAIYEGTEDIAFQNTALYTKNTFANFGKFEMINKDDECGRADNTQECKRTFKIGSSRLQPVRSSQAPVKVTSSPLLPVVGVAPFVGVNDILGFEDTQDVNETFLAQQLTARELLEYDIPLDLSSIDEDIPSSQFVFNGENALIRESENYLFRFNFHILAGLGLVEVAFYSLEGNKTFSMLLHQQEGKIYTLHYLDGLVDLKETAANLQGKNEKSFRAEYKENVVISLGRDQLFNLTGVDLSSGYFTLSTFHTHLQNRGLSIEDRWNNKRINLRAETDPCKLRLVDELVLGEDTLFLDHDEYLSETYTFNLSGEFDYGLVSVELEETVDKDESEIHFWVINNE